MKMKVKILILTIDLGIQESWNDWEKLKDVVREKGLGKKC